MTVDHPNLWLAGPLAFFVTWLVLQVLLRSRVRRVLLDEPNARSLHQSAVPRMGGIGLAAGLAVVVLVYFGLFGLTLPAVLAASLAGYLALFLISIADDLRGLGAGLRLVAQLLLALLITALMGINPVWILPLSVVLAWGANLFNFMDGSDGLAGGMATIGFGSYAGAALWAGDPPLMILASAVSAAALGFLMLNFNPARLFMGDSGSVPLGFFAGALGVAGSLRGVWPPWTPLIVFFPFIFDATLTLVRREAQGKPLAQAHREHIYQRAVLQGLSHRSLAWRAYGLMVLSATLGLASIFLSGPIAGLIIALQTGVGLFLDRRVAPSA